jgi:hypothetical protein
LGEVLSWTAALIIGLCTAGILGVSIWGIWFDYFRTSGKCPNCDFRPPSATLGKTELHSCNGIYLPYTTEHSRWLVPFEDSDAYALQLIICPFCQSQTPRFEPYCLSCGLVPTAAGVDRAPYLGWIPKSKPQKR